MRDFNNEDCDLRSREKQFRIYTNDVPAQNVKSNFLDAIKKIINTVREILLLFSTIITNGGVPIIDPVKF